MTDAAKAQAELAAAKMIWRATQMFSVLEFVYLAIAVLLVIFVYQKHAKDGSQIALTPLRFIMFVGSMLGITAFLTLYWGVSHVIFALAFGVGMTVSFVDPVAATGFLLANLLVRPWEMANMAEMGFIPKTLGALALLSWIFHAARAKQLSLLLNWPCRFYFALVVWFVISEMTSGDLLAGLTDFSGTMMIVTIIFILLTNVPRTELDLSILEKVLLIAITGSIAHALLVTITQDGFDSSSAFRLEDAGMTGNSNDLGAIIVQALPFAIVPAIMAGKHFSRRVLAIVATPILVTGLWLTQSRGTTLGVLVSIVTYFTIKAKNKRRAGLIIAGLVPLIFVFMSAMNLARNSDDLEGSTDSRKAFVIAGINMGIHNPLMGVGVGNFPKVWENYAIGKVVETGTRTAHNTWVLAFAELGLPGLILLVSIFVSTFRKALVTHKTHPELMCALTGYAVAMSFLSHTYAFFPYILFGLIIASAKIHSMARAEVRS